MIASAEGHQYEVKNNNIDKNEDENKNDDDNSTVDETPGEIVNDLTNKLVEFLKKNDLLDIKDELLSSKLNLSHFKEVEKSDLNELCNDLKLTSSQKIRLKHAIKSLQKQIKRKKSQRASQRKLKSDSIKNKMKNFKKRKHHKNDKNEKNEENKQQLNPPNDSNANKMKHIGVNHKNNIRKIRSKLVIVGEAGVGKTTLQKC